LFRQNWVVYAKPPFGGPHHVLGYLARYTRLKDEGYEIEKGKSGQPEIAGYTREYLDASSPRSQQIQAYLEQQGDWPVKPVIADKYSEPRIGDFGIVGPRRF
jgi:hypothetical protein